jgi:2-polyprenyl-6-methoxyphenol hydroxylase-like FAD-dependent oxidoreductase
MKIIISGAGIAGLTVATLLQRKGHQPIVIEKARSFSNSGYVLSLKSFGVEIMRELGLEDKLRTIAAQSRFANFFKKNGALVRELSYGVINKNLADSILATRGDIHHVIFEAIKNVVEIRYGTTIQSSAQNDDKVSVILSDGGIINADLLIISEGLRSQTREKIWRDSSVEDFNIFYAAGRLEGIHSYKVGSFQTYRGIKKMLAVLPLNENELALQCYIHNKADVNQTGAIENGILSDSFLGFNDRVTGLIRKLEMKGGIFSDKIGMVHIPHLNQGRTVLLGDAGYCPTSFSGMGASLAIYGAKALVHFIDQQPNDINKALEDFNKLMQPIVLKFQNNARKNAKTFLPMNNTRLKLNDFLLKYTPDYFITRKLSGELTLTDQQRKFQMA